MNNNSKKIFDGMISDHPRLRYCGDAVTEAFELLRGCFLKGGRLMACGNGGSAADAGHIVGELMKGFMNKRAIREDTAAKIVSLFPGEGESLAAALQGALPAISLASQAALMTAVINDMGADMVFAQQVYGYGRTGDVLMALSTSGNSPNIINAVRTAKALGVISIGMTGRDGGLMKDICDHIIRMPADETHRVQECFLPVYHTLCAMLENEFF